MHGTPEQERASGERDHVTASRLVGRVLARLYRSTCVSLGIDPVTKLRIRRRSDLAKLGGKGGAWSVPEQLLGPSSVVYCVGCGEDISFDLALMERIGCTVHAFDPTPRAIAYVDRVAGKNPKYQFQAVGLWSERKIMRFFAPREPQHVSHSLLNMQGTEEYFEAPVERLRDLQAALGHETLDLLKLDIEGAEYEVLRTLAEDSIFPRVLCVEFDEFFHPLDEKWHSRIVENVQRLVELGYELVFTPGNANYTFVHTRSVEPASSRGSARRAENSSISGQAWSKLRSNEPPRRGQDP